MFLFHILLFDTLCIAVIGITITLLLIIDVEHFV